MKQLVTTYLEMRSLADLRRSGMEFGARRWEIKAKNKDWRFNRDMYFAVGEKWKWIDKQPWTDERWKEYAIDPNLQTFAGYYDATLAGYYELHWDAEPDRRNHAVEIAYLGLLPEFIGRGLGGALLTSAIENAWMWSPSRVWVHTCYWDHPSALANYQARGFRISKVEGNCPQFNPLPGGEADSEEIQRKPGAT